LGSEKYLKELILIGGLTGPAKTALVHLMASRARGPKTLLLLSSVHQHPPITKISPEKLIVNRLPNGCICCTAVSELLQILDVTSTDSMIGSVVVDISDLVDIAQILMHLKHRHIEKSYQITAPLIAIDTSCRFFKKRGEIPLINRLINENFQYFIFSESGQKDLDADNFCHLIARVGLENIQFMRSNFPLLSERSQLTLEAIL
jgi:G3E family GTPase